MHMSRFDTDISSYLYSVTRKYQLETRSKLIKMVKVAKNSR